MVRRKTNSENLPMPMTIAQAARAAGVGVETIRFYERRGLIEQPPKPDGPGFRTYTEETIQRVRFIRQAQELGFSLREAGEILKLRAHPGADAADVHARASAKILEVQDKIAALRRIQGALEALIEACPRTGALRSCSIMEALDGPASDRSGAYQRPGTG
jgi:MerR family mercuric resistance operon transcriptional regulator